MMDSLQNAKSLKILIHGLCGPGQGLEVQGQGLINWSLGTRTFLEDYRFVVRLCVVKNVMHL